MVFAFESYSLCLFWKSLLITQSLPFFVYSETYLPLGDTLICVKGPFCNTRSSHSEASTTYIVCPIARSTSTDRESVYAGGSKVHECTVSSGGVMRSFGRGSS